MIRGAKGVARRLALPLALAVVACFMSGAARAQWTPGAVSIFAAPSATPMPVISRNVPAFASSNLNAASGANDSDYTTYWRGAIPSTLTYNLSSVPVAQRHQVIVGWYNDPQTTPYDHTLIGDTAYNNLRDYTLQGNPAPTAGSPPASGWVTLATVTGNRYHSRQHLLDLTGYNWLRISVTGSDGSAGNADASINLDVHDASAGVGDSWIFYGDSITQEGMNHEPENTTGNFAQLINAANPSYFPAYENGGIGGIGAQDGANNINAWLAVFPGRYVGISLGTNDANGCASTTTFYNNYVTMINAVLAAGKVPIVPTIPWARTANVQSCGPGFNAKIQQLYTAYPQIVHGPDLWAYFQSHQNLISGDDLHPSTAGYVAYRQQWASAMLSAIYTPSGPAPAVTLTPASLGFGNQRVGTTSSSQTSTLKNTGSASLTISSLGVTGTNAGDFAQTNDCPGTLAVNATCTITVTFTPGATGARSGRVTITDDASDSPQNLTLTGTGTAPAVGFNPTSLGFGSQTVGVQTAPLSTTLTNTGTAPLAIGSISITGTNAADFAQTNTCPATLAAGANCSISVRFTPGATGARSASLSVADDASGSPQTVALTGTGVAAAPAVTLTPNSVGFGNQRVGTTSAAQTSTLKNTGTASLTISSLAVAGTNAADFAQTNDCPATLAVNATCTISVTFTPGATGARSGRVSVTDDAGDSPQNLTLTGTGTAPAVGFNPTSLGFGTQAVGVQTTPLSTTLTNTGTAALAIGSISITGTNAGDFAQTNTCPASLAAGANCSISVRFTPGATGARSASLSVADDAAGSPQTVALTGTGAATAPAVTLTPASLGFGNQRVGTASATQTSTLKNTGTASLTIASITVAGTNAADFAQTNNCPATLAVNATCTISVTFTPGATGARAASVTVSDNAPAAPHSVALSGSGALPAVSLAPSNLAFAGQMVGTTSAAQVLSVYNSGDARLSIASVGLTGANAADFGLTTDCPLAPATVAAGSGCSVTIRFTPGAAGPRSAAVSIVDDAAGSPHGIVVSGTGVAPVPLVTLAPASLDFGSRRVGAAGAAKTLVLSNSGTGTAAISSVAITGPNAGDFAQTNDCGATIAPGASCTISVSFVAKAVGARSAALVVTDSAAGSPRAVALSGTGAKAGVEGRRVRPRLLRMLEQLVVSGVRLRH